MTSANELLNADRSAVGEWHSAPGEPGVRSHFPKRSR
jgi:hypothetical protein